MDRFPSKTSSQHQFSEEIFLSGAVNMDREASVRVLNIGLGAGYVNSYLHHHFPKMEITIVEIDPKMVEIARKWFDLTLDDRQRIVIGDGLEYIKKAVEKGEKYDVVLLDACNMGENGACPLWDMMNKEIARTFSSLLTERGALISNVFNFAGKTIKMGKKVVF
ncbi:hypothetical protein Y032_0168g167 [Ancylostoma ceylanicum]|uniref:PABS domain-containing protein n=1 Tax=Ancylostoma ceylanicum TaxID=53326 RepID=A0A016SVX7_9BILA|nr:hypothetical protein Y032_0168g167 [Ancylostoma ceylanicum]